MELHIGLTDAIEHLQEICTLLNTQMEAREIYDGTKCVYSGFYILKIYFIGIIFNLFSPFYSRDASPYPIMKGTFTKCDLAPGSAWFSPLSINKDIG